MACEAHQTQLYLTEKSEFRNNRTKFRAKRHFVQIKVEY